MAAGSVNCITPFAKVSESEQLTTKSQLDKAMLFGLSDGSFINVMLQPEEPVYLWHAGVDSQIRKAGVSLIKAYDFLGRGVNDVALVRDDSTIEVFTLNSDKEYELQYSTALNEGVTAIDAGQVNVLGTNEFVISTYSGKVIGYLDNEEVAKTEAKKPKEAQNPKDLEKKIKALRAENDKLKQSIDQMKAEVPVEKTLVRRLDQAYYNST